MSDLDDYIRNVEEVSLPALRRELEALETGAHRTGKREAVGPWIDTTAENIVRLRRAIAEYLSVVASLRKGKTR